MPEVMILTRKIEVLLNELNGFPLHKKIAAINLIRQMLHEHSPFADEPVDCVQWVLADKVVGNNYNPNTVAPPEMQLLSRSIDADGFTQPIVAYPERPERYVVVDGFHRQRVGKTEKRIRQRLHGFLPIVLIRGDREEAADRIAATIRHNRARGVHAVPPMTEIIVTLLKNGWNDADIARELGMDADEIIRFKQVSGLPELFQGHPFSRSWE